MKKWLFNTSEFKTEYNSKELKQTSERMLYSRRAERKYRLRIDTRIGVRRYEVQRIDQY